MVDVNLSPYTVDQQTMDRRRKLAEAMQQQAVLPIEMPTVPGAKVSPYAGLAKLLQGYIAGKNIEKSDAEQKAYESATMEDFAKILRNSGKTETIPGEVTTPAVTGKYPEKQNTLPTGEAYPAVDISAGAMPITPSSAEVRAPDRQVPLLTADALNNPNFMKTSAGRMMLAQALLQQKSQEQAAAQAAQAAALQVHPLAAGGALVQNGRVIAERAKEETFHPPVTQIDPVTGMPQTVAFSNLGTRKVIDTAGAYTPDQWNSMSMADKAKMLFDQYKFGNLSAEQLVQAGQKNAQLAQELQKLQFETGKGGPGPVSIPRNAPMPNLLNPAPVGIPAVNPAATPAVNAQPVVAPGSQVAPVVNQALAPAVKKPYRPLNAPSPVATPVPVVAPTPVATGEQPPAGLSPKATQQWIVENSKKQIELTKDKPQAELSATTALTNLSRMKNVAEELSQHKGLNSIVGKWNQYSIFDTSDNAINARALQGTLVKQSATAALQAMRDASKTGGAVGGVSEKEWPILEQQIAALDSAQTPKAYRTALENLKSQVDSSMTNIRKAYEIQHGKLEFTPPKYYRQDEIQPSAWKVVQ